MLRIGPVELATPLLLAPIAGYCDLAFRLVVRSLRDPAGGVAVGLASTDLICSQAVVRAAVKTLDLAATCPQDTPLCVQLYGADAEVLADAARWAQDRGAAIIDINMGCPVDKVTKTNGGSMLLCDPPSTIALAAKVVRAVRCPVTAKLRLGWDDRHLTATALAPALADVGIAAITVHGRTTQQRFRGPVSLEGIAAIVAALRRHPWVPVIGNGDVNSPLDARRMLDATGCHGVMIGRGALAQPWVFRDTAPYLATGQLPPPLSQADRARIVLDHFDTMLRLGSAPGPAAGHHGPGYCPQTAALHKMRARISWYSAGLQPWPGLRREVNAMGSAAELRAYLAAAIDRLDRGLAAVPGYALHVQP
jgi:nifR3 family TIM-barrel protein